MGLNGREIWGPTAPLQCWSRPHFGEQIESDPIGFNGLTLSQSNCNELSSTKCIAAVVEWCSPHLGTMNILIAAGPHPHRWTLALDTGSEAIDPRNNSISISLLSLIDISIIVSVNALCYIYYGRLIRRIT